MATLLLVGEGAAFDRIENMLLAEGHFVPRTQSSAQAPEIIKQYKPDVVLAELHPTPDACLTTMRRLQRNMASGLLPWILFTPRGDVQEMRRCLNAGASDYLVHPARKKDILATIRVRLQTKARVEYALEQRINTLRLSISTALPHEIRTPLSSIIGFTHLLQKQLPTLMPNEIQEMAELSHRSALRIQHLLENFLYFSNLEALATDRERLRNLRARSTSKFSDKLTALARKTSLAYRRLDDLSVRLEDAEIRIGKIYWIKVFEELIDNAFKFSEAGTQVQVESTVENRMYVLAIRDYGVGMHEDIQAYVGAFNQIERGTHEQSGVGLGLAIVSRILALHRGRFLVKSEPSAGTTVAAYVPLA